MHIVFESQSLLFKEHGYKEKHKFIGGNAMVISMAATSACDENEVTIHIMAESGECIHIGDRIQIPMNDHTFEEREVIDMYRDWKKWRSRKGLFNKIEAGEWAECIVRNIHSGRIHTISSPYDEKLSEDGWIFMLANASLCQVSSKKKIPIKP